MFLHLLKISLEVLGGLVVGGLVVGGLVVGGLVVGGLVVGGLVVGGLVVGGFVVCGFVMEGGHLKKNLKKKELYIMIAISCENYYAVKSIYLPINAVKFVNISLRHITSVPKKLLESFIFSFYHYVILNYGKIRLSVMHD